MDARIQAHARIDRMTDNQIGAMLAYIQQMLEQDDDEAIWEDAVLTEALGNAMREDGTIDYSKLQILEVSLAVLAAEAEFDFEYPEYPPECQIILNCTVWAEGLDQP